MSHSIGIGIVTCNRPEFFSRCYASIPEHLREHVVIVNDGDTKLSPESYSPSVLLNNETNIGVGKSKNRLFRELSAGGYEYFFIIEDDMLILDPSIFDKYIEAYKVTGIHHFMFAYHGPANKGGISKGTPQPRMTVRYNDKVAVTLNQHCVGAFCFYTRKSLKDVGLFDENYVNAFEHVDHSYKLAKKQYSPPYWWWADLANSTDLITEQECSENSSSIRFKDTWSENIQIGYRHFLNKNGVSPVEVPDTDEDVVVCILKLMKSVV